MAIAPVWRGGIGSTRESRHPTIAGFTSAQRVKRERRSVGYGWILIRRHRGSGGLTNNAHEDKAYRPHDRPDYDRRKVVQGIAKFHGAFSS